MDNNEQERETHFLGFAQLLYPELARLFVALMSYRVMGEEDKAKLIAYQIQELLAQRAYDLVEHTIEYDANEITVYPEDIPDLTAWPTPEGH